MKLPQKHLYNKYYYFLLCCFSMIFYTISGYATENKKDLAIWPRAESGYKQIIIQLPPLKNEDLYRVELIPEKTMEKDCNHFMISGSFETKPLTGWGYEYYILNKIGMPASTKMACIPDTKNLTAIAIQTDLPFIRYNSKIPLVTYIPKNIHLSYRIWSTGSLQNAESKR